MDSSGTDTHSVDHEMVKKRKRMESNRESARRSRLRKQHHLDNLMAEAANLQKLNRQLLINITVIKQNTADVEAKNSELRNAERELTKVLQFLTQILNGTCMLNVDDNDDDPRLGQGLFNNSNYPIMASAAHMFDMSFS